MALRDTARALEALPTTALEAASDAIVDLAETVGGRVMGRPLTASYRIDGTSGAAISTIHGTPTAFWVWETDGTNAHVIGTRRGGRALLLAGAAHPIAPPVVHPGTSGRDAWRQVARSAAHLAPAVVAEHVHEAVT